MEDETKRKIRAAAEFIAGDPNSNNIGAGAYPDYTKKDMERIKNDPNIKSQMQKMMGCRYPGQRQENSGVATVVGVLGFVVFIAIVGVLIWLS